LFASHYTRSLGSPLPKQSTGQVQLYKFRL